MISHVCRSWRAAALSASWLWEWVNPYWPLRQNEAWFSRAHEHPISVWVGTEDNKGMPDRWRFIAFTSFIQRHSKYRALSINGGRFECCVFRDPLEKIQQVMKAETLILNSFGSIFWSLGDLEFLRHLYLDGCNLTSDSIVTMKGLVSLGVSGDFPISWSHSGILKQVSGTLETLIYTHFSMDISDCVSVRLENLQNLIIGWSFYNRAPLSMIRFCRFS